MRGPSFSLGAFAIAVMLGAPACGTPSSSSAGATTGSTTEAPRPPAVEATLYPAQKPILSDLPVTKLLPGDTAAVLAVRDPATIVAKLATLGAFNEAKDPLAKAIDEAAKDLSKDLPDLAALAQNGVDLTKPAGVAWMNAELDTIAIFAAVSDEAAMKRWIDERAKQAKNRRELLTVGDAVVLRAKSTVTRAIVLRRGHVFWVRSIDRWGLDPERVPRASDALAKVAEPDSLGAAATFTKTLGSLAYGAQAALYVNAIPFAESLVASRAKQVEDAKKKRDDAAAALADAEKKKQKSAIESAKYDLGQAESALRSAESAATRSAVLTELKDEVAAIAAGVDLGEREVRLKALVAMPKPGAAKLFAPLAAPSPVLDPSLDASAAAHSSMDPRLLAFLSDHLGVKLPEAATSTPTGSWLSSADHPVLKQLATIDGATGVLAFDAETYRRARAPDLFDRREALRDIGVLGALLGPQTKNSKKLEEQREKLRAQQRELESAFAAHQEATWSAFAARAGTTALFAKPTDGGVALYGGLFPKEPTLTALADAALAAWLDAGPRWEKWRERVALEKKIHDLDDRITAERQQAMDDLVGGVLGGLGAGDASGRGQRPSIAGFDDDVGVLLADPHFGAPDPPRVGTARGTGGIGGIDRGSGSGRVTIPSGKP